jgi:hypothetical protein
MTTPQPSIEPAPVVTELFASLRPIYTAAFEKAAFGEQLTWEFGGVTMLNTPQGPQTQLVIYMHIVTPHPLGSHLQRLVFMQIGLSADIIEKEIRVQVEDLKQLRTKMLMETNGHLPQPGPGKLILPS